MTKEELDILINKLNKYGPAYIEETFIFFSHVTTMNQFWMKASTKERNYIVVKTKGDISKYLFNGQYKHTPILDIINL